MEAISPAHGHVLGHFIDFVEQNDADVAFLKVESDTFHAVFKLHKLVGAHIVETIDMSHTVAHFEDCAHLFERDFGVDVFELLL